KRRRRRKVAFSCFLKDHDAVLPKITMRAASSAWTRGMRVLVAPAKRMSVYLLSAPRPKASTLPLNSRDFGMFRWQHFGGSYTACRARGRGQHGSFRGKLPYPRTCLAVRPCRVDPG